MAAYGEGLRGKRGSAELYTHQLLCEANFRWQMVAVENFRFHGREHPSGSRIGRTSTSVGARRLGRCFRWRRLNRFALRNALVLQMLADKLLQFAESFADSQRDSSMPRWRIAIFCLSSSRTRSKVVTVALHGFTIASAVYSMNVY